MVEETIVAIATAMGEGSIGVIRLSGPAALKSAQRIFRLPGGEKEENPRSRHVTYGYIADPKNEETIDEALFIYMPGPHSYTGEDVVELQLHGSSQSLKVTLAFLLNEPGIRLAEPGEFTQRAFLNGRMDLSQAEAVIDIIRSRTERSLKASAGQLEGGLSKKIKELSDRLLHLIGQLEVVIEYPEDSLEEMEYPKIQKEIQEILIEVEQLRKSGREGRILREGLATAIIGLPNVGKSSLLNYLLGEERAIVTEIPGTTRDMIEEFCSLGGIPLRLIDTAGIRDTEDRIEKIGINRSKKALAEAQLVFMVLDGSREMVPEELALLEEAGNDRAIILINKSDLVKGQEDQAIREALEEKKITAPVLSISAYTGEGMQGLEEEVKKWIHQDGALMEGRPLVSNVRQIEALHKGERALQEALDAIETGLPGDCILVDLREGWARICEVSGQAVSDEIISHIFSQFCLGK